MAIYKFHTLDVFTTSRFTGNPLAVVLDADALTTEQMQTVAREFNLSETIFVRTPVDNGNTASVRIFFPTAEIPFAGHPTVGCAILLAELEHQQGGDFDMQITLEEVAGLVPVHVRRNGGEISAQFTAPVVPYKLDQPMPDLALFAEGFGLEPEEVGLAGHVPAVCEGGPNFCYVPLATTDALARAKPSGAGWERLKQAANQEAFYLYTPINGGFRARMFAPDHGIAEDPATGSASALFAAQLLSCGELSEGTNHRLLKQGYDMGRPSDIGLEIDVRDQTLTAVRVSGSAIRVMEGSILV